MGAAGCFLAMALINPVACVVALCVEVLIFYSLSTRSLEATWGDVRSGLALTGARWALMNLRSLKFEARNWRPHILVFVRDLSAALPVVKMADYFGQSRGIVTVVTLLEGDIESHDADPLLERNRKIIRSQGLESAFCEVTAVPDVDSGIITVTQSNGRDSTPTRSCLNTEMAALPRWRLLGLARKLSKLNKYR